MNKLGRFCIVLLCLLIVEFSSISLFETNNSVKASKPKFNSAEENLDLLLIGNLDEVINDFNKYDSLKINDVENLEAFTTALIAYGDIKRAYPLLDYATKKFPKNNKFRSDLKSLLLFDQDFEAAKACGLTNSEKAHIELKKAFYGENKLDLNDHEIREFIYNELLSKIDNRSPYFPSRLEYLYFLKTESARQEARRISINIIEKFSEIAFPQTLDFYELAEAYRILGLLAYDSKTDSEAYFEMARLNQGRMRSLWLIEDIRIYSPIMKILTRSTRFGYVFPQWIVSLNQFQ
ncbi:MAG: hypothetical protein VKK32_05300 [Candidatus Melainabacteria bacterium]|nr:hypothetical protein [Candidatus Melainabacteria bacterium]